MKDKIKNVVLAVIGVVGIALAFMKSKKKEDQIEEVKPDDK